MKHKGGVTYGRKTMQSPQKWGGMSKYSTSEVLTGDTWIDGKPVYEIVLKDAITLDSSTRNSRYDISSLHVDTPIECMGSIDTVSNKACSFYIWTDGNFSNTEINVPFFDRTYAWFYRTKPSSQSGAKVTFILRYTKTTD